ncbi:ATP-dependent DNA helicase [Dyadobacter jiangsuensis]
MTTTTSSTIFDLLSFEATREQAKALYQLEEFIDPACEEDVFVLRGAAGTGKTSLVKAVVDFLEKQEIGCYLTAPTGRAAKVLGYKTHSIANTVHHTIYRVIPTDDERIVMERKANTQDAYSIFVVDEASMISDRNNSEGNFQTPGSLLFDLLVYVKQGNRRNKIIFIGDRYQLAPVNESESVALNLQHFMKKYDLTGQQAELTEVKRQEGNSPVLTLAHDIRRKADAGCALGKLNVNRLYNFTAGVTRYVNLYDTNRPDNVVMIGSANKNVHTFNKLVRERLGLSGTLAIGDQVVVNENWIDNHNLIVKGETGLVRGIDDSIEKRADLEFITAKIEFQDPEHRPLLITTKVLLDTLKTDKGELPGEMLRNLKADRMAKNSSYRANPNPANDPYIGAMRLRYGHGLTGYKAQGGEWNHVLLHPWFQENDYRYAYTAITRARETVTSWEKEGWGRS